MKATGESRDGVQVFTVAGVPCRDSGLHGYTVRVLPNHPDEAGASCPALVAWAGERAKAAAG